MPSVQPDEHVASTLYFDGAHEKHAVKILPGEYYVTDRDMLLVTVLGSCVSACIRDPIVGVAGMNHFMLPEGRDGDGVLSASARYGTYAMELLINQLLKIGARRNALEAKVFGGGNVLPGLTLSNVGERNAAFVLDYLATERIPVAARDLGGLHPRKIYQFAHSGRVRVKQLARTNHDNDTLFARERDYRRQLEAPVTGDVELFG
jgi:chemotaxis protein CheD